jgi:VanZ family protein
VTRSTNAWRAIPAILWMALIFGLSSQSHFDAPGGISVDVLAVVAHLILYGVLAGSIWFAIRHVSPVRPMKTFVTVIILTTLYGITDEVHQAFVPLRDASLFDVGVDFCAALIVTSVLTAITSLRHAGHRP